MEQIKMLLQTAVVKKLAVTCSLDLAKAFNAISHHILLSKLELYLLLISLDYTYRLINPGKNTLPLWLKVCPLKLVSFSDLANS